MFTKKRFDDLDDVRELVKENIKDLRNYIIEKAEATDNELEKVINAEEKELPKLINVKSLAAQEYLKHRLRNKGCDIEPLLNLELFLDIIYSTALDSDDYKDLGINDGQICETARLAYMLGMENEAKKAYEAKYFE